MARRVTEQEYDMRIAVHNKVARVEKFIDTQTRILHRCLIHNYECMAYPSNMIKGHGLYCCGKTKNKSLQNKNTYSEKVLKLGKMEVVDEYVGLNKEIRHRCLKHGHVELAKPLSVLNGAYLSCCGTSTSNALLRDTYKERVKSIGRVECLEDYVDSEIPLLHRCPTHNYTGYCLPKSILSGYGLSCCGSRGRNWTCRDSYVQRVNEIGKVEVLGSYVNSTTPILHRCLEHNHVALAQPSSILSGKSLECCKYRLESILNLLNKDDRRDTCVYLYKLSNFSGFVKLGISNNVKFRAKDPHYGDFICSWHSNSRLECYCVEQASLKDVALTKNCPEKLQKNKWIGCSEVLNCPEDLAVQVVQYYWDYMQKVGPYQFILEYLSPGKKERQICLIRTMELLNFVNS
jgi:hypothetical protein